MTKNFILMLLALGSMYPMKARSASYLVPQETLSDPQQDMLITEIHKFVGSDANYVGVDTAGNACFFSIQSSTPDSVVLQSTGINLSLGHLDGEFQYKVLENTITPLANGESQLKLIVAIHQTERIDFVNLFNITEKNGFLVSVETALAGPLHGGSHIQSGDVYADQDFVRNLCSSLTKQH